MKKKRDSKYTKAPATKKRHDFKYIKASPKRRAIAGIIDIYASWFIYGLVFALPWEVLYRLQIVESRTIQGGPLVLPFLIIFILAWFFSCALYYGIADSRPSGGLGKRIMKLRVLNNSGEILSFQEAFKRGMRKAGALFPIAYVGADYYFGKDRLTTYDRKSKTDVYMMPDCK